MVLRKLSCCCDKIFLQQPCVNCQKATLDLSLALRWPENERRNLEVAETWKFDFEIQRWHFELQNTSQLTFANLKAYNSIVSAWVLIPLANLNPAFLLALQLMKISTIHPRQTKSPDNSNTLNMFINNSTYTNFKTEFKHMSILQWCHAQGLFGSQIPETTGGFELQSSCIRSSYLTH